MLRFSERATIAEHEAPMEVDVVCLDGGGSVSVGDETFVFRAGDTIRWPAYTMHRLWTEASEMTTLMIEHHA